MLILGGLGRNACQKLNFSVYGLVEYSYFLFPLDQIVYETGLDFVVFTGVLEGGRSFFSRVGF